MRLVYWKTSHGNFGDDLNTWLWDGLIPTWRGMSPDVDLVGVGSILNAEFLDGGRRKVVLGSGVGYGILPTLRPAAEWDVRYVRGPRSAAALGLPAEAAIADSAVMLPRLPQFERPERHDDVIFVPHWDSLDMADWEAACAEAGVSLVSPCGDAVTVIRRIAGARLVIAESMHGAIVADSFGAPFVPVSISPRFHSFKWRDWAESLGMDLTFRNLLTLRRLDEPVESFPEYAATVKRRAEAAQLHRKLWRRTPGFAKRLRRNLTTARARRGLAALRDAALKERAGVFLSDRATLMERQDGIFRALEAVVRDYK